MGKCLWKVSYRLSQPSNGGSAGCRNRLVVGSWRALGVQRLAHARLNNGTARAALIATVEQVGNMLTYQRQFF